MFSGQGSQYYHMGRELYETHQTFRRWMHELDITAHLICGESILEHLYDQTKRKSDPFDQLLYTHPAIFMVEYALAEVILERGIKPDYTLGTSIGEFAAAAISGVMTAEECLSALIRQAEVVEKYCREGGMYAILHDPRLYYETPLIYENSELVSINFHSHFVISSRIDSLHRIAQHLKENQIDYQALPVPRAFHSSFIDPAAEVYMSFLNQKSCRLPRIPYVSGTYANVLTKIDSGYFWEVVRKPIQFQKAFRELEKRQDCIYLDLGPSGTLATFVKYNLPEDSIPKSLAVLTPFGRDLKNIDEMERLFDSY